MGCMCMCRHVHECVYVCVCVWWQLGDSSRERWQDGRSPRKTIPETRHSEVLRRARVWRESSSMPPNQNRVILICPGGQAQPFCPHSVLTSWVDGDKCCVGSGADRVQEVLWALVTADVISRRLSDPGNTGSYLGTLLPPGNPEHLSTLGGIGTPGFSL